MTRDRPNGPTNLDDDASEAQEPQAFAVQAAAAPHCGVTAEGDFIGAQAVLKIRGAIEQALDTCSSDTFVLDLTRLKRAERLTAGAVGFEAIRIRERGRSLSVHLPLHLTPLMVPVLCPLPSVATLRGQLSRGTLYIELPGLYTCCTEGKQ
jgi:hypothetical protein